MKKIFLSVVLVIVLVVGVSFFSLNSRKDRLSKVSFDLGTVMDGDGSKVKVYAQGGVGNKKLKIIDAARIAGVFEYLKDDSFSKEVSKIYIYISEKPDFMTRLDGRKDPQTGELLTAYGWEYNDGELGVPIYIKPEYLDNVDGGYLDAMVCASVWYFLVENNYWTNEEYGPQKFRDFYYNELADYGQMVEIN